MGNLKSNKTHEEYDEIEDAIQSRHEAMKIPEHLKVRHLTPDECYKRKDDPVMVDAVTKILTKDQKEFLNTCVECGNKFEENSSYCSDECLRAALPF